MRDLQDLTISDVIEMSPRERDRLCASGFMDEYIHYNIDVYQTFIRKPFDPEEPPPRYHEKWKHAGRVLEALPEYFKDCPVHWISENISKPAQEKGLEIDEPCGLCKESIVLAACICAVEGVEPNGGE